MKTRNKFTIIFTLITTLNYGLLSCSKTEEQNLDIVVNGKVTNQNNTGLSDVMIYIQRGKTGNYAATIYQQYKTIKTNSSGNYSYLVKNDTYNYKICCDIPYGYTIVDQGCNEVNHNIINSKTVPNIINFKLTN